MSISQWSGRRLAITWAVGILLEASVVTVLVSRGRAETARFDLEMQELRRSSQSVSQAQQDSVFASLNEKYGVNIVRRGDTVTAIELSSEAQRKLDRLGGGFRRAILLALLWAVVVYLTIPFTLLGVSVVWLRAQRARRQADVISPVA